MLSSLPAFSHFLHYPQVNWALLVLIPVWMGLCTLWDPVGLSNKFCREAGSFSCCRLNPQGVFNGRFDALFPHTGALVLRGLFCSPFVPPGLSACKCGTTWSSSCCLAPSPLCSGCPSPPLLPVWINVSSLTPWLLEFYTVRFFWQF